MKLTNNYKSLAAVAGLALVAGSANASTILSSEDFENATTPTDFANTDYDKGPNDTVIDLNGIANNPSDAGDNLTHTIDFRSSNRLLILRDALPLATNGHTSVTVDIDLQYNYSNDAGQYGVKLEYSALGDFTDSQTVTTWSSGDFTTNLWTAASTTIDPGTVGAFTDTAKIRFRSGGWANSTHSQQDNIVITGVGGVPEPSTTALLGVGGLALILRRRK